jgi:hypothetical protein
MAKRDKLNSPFMFSQKTHTKSMYPSPPRSRKCRLPEGYEEVFSLADELKEFGGGKFKYIIISILQLSSLPLSKISLI